VIPSAHEFLERIDHDGTRLASLNGFAKKTTMENMGITAKKLGGINPALAVD
jgi:hypothetical protein